VASHTVLAQSDTGKIIGIARDPNGATVSRVTIVAESSNGTRRVAVSGEFGAFEIPSLPVGKYEIVAESKGFKKYIRQLVSVNVNQESRVDIELVPGEIYDTVTVREEVGLVQSTTSTLGKVVYEKSIIDLPLNGRNFLDLGLLQTGVVPLQPGRTLTQNAYNVNGARDTANNFLLDGVANQDLEYNNLQIKPTIDALSEFKIQTNLFSAEFGRNAGAVINAVTKSGSNSLHGTLWEFLRNDALDARNFFSQDTPSPPSLQEEDEMKLHQTPLKTRTNQLG
jgi:Carboxypeptidase regulatory-like domain